MVKTFIRAISGILFAASLSPWATLYAQPNIFYSASPELIVDILYRNGYRANLEFDPGNVPIIEVDTENDFFIILFNKCENNDSCKSVTLSVAFDLPDGSTYRQMNTVNSITSFAGAHIERDKDPYVSQELIIDGGITEENFINNIKQWEFTLSLIKDIIGW